jgi:hypothetical protein
MNGTIYDEIKKNSDSKKKEKIKFALTIVSTNLLVAMLCMSFNGPPTAPTQSIITNKQMHPHFKMIVIPLKLLLDLDQYSSEIPVTIMTKSKQILISKAFLHEEIKSPSASGENLSRFKIEIPEDEVLKLSADSEIEMIAIPEIKIPIKEKLNINKRVSQYEINL